MRKKGLPIIALATVLALSNIPHCSYTVRAEETTEEIITEEILDNTEEVTEESSENLTEETTEEFTEESIEDLTEETTEENNSIEETSEEESTEESTEENIEEEEFIEMDITLLNSTPSTDPLAKEEDANIVISNETEWSDFIARNDDVWQNGTYKGHCDNVTITFSCNITDDITISVSPTTGDYTYYESTTDTAIDTTKTYYISDGAGSYNAVDTSLLSETDLPLYYEAKTINIPDTTAVALTINGGSFSSDINLTDTNGNIILNGLSLNNVSIETSSKSLNITNGEYTDTTTLFSMNESNISEVSLTNTDINLESNADGTVNNISGCTMNNSHIIVSQIPCELNISNTTFNGNTKSIIDSTSNIPYYVTLTNVTGTDCHYDFIHIVNRSCHISSINGLNISTSDAGLSGIFSDYSLFAIADFKNSTIDGFDYAININRSSPCGDMPSCVIFDNVDMLNCGVCGFYSESATGYPFNLKECTITGKDGAETGVLFKSTGVVSSSMPWTTLFSENLGSLTCVDGCDISNFYTGVKGYNAPALAIDCYIHNVNSGVIGVSTTGTCAYRCILEAKENPDEESYGVAQISSSGCELCDCDVTGFYVGACNIRPNGVGGGGSVEAYGCRFIDNIKAGLCGYSSTAKNCLFTGSTEIMFMSRSVANSIFECTFIGDGTNIGAESWEVYIYLNQGQGIAQYAHQFEQFSNRDLSKGKTEFSNFAIGLNAPHSGGIQGGNVYVHDCDTAISLTCDGFFLINDEWHIENCDNGIVFHQMYNGGNVLIEDCNIGLQDEYDTVNDTGYSSWLTNGGVLTCKNCDTGIHLHKGFSTNSNMTINLEGNRIGAILDNPRGSASTGSVFLKNNSEIGIKYISPTQIIHVSGNEFLVDGETQALYIDGVFNIFSPTFTATGEDDYYLASDGSYLDLSSAYSLTNYKFLFDMPNEGYQEGRKVAETTAPDYIDNFYTKKQGWIVIQTQQVNNLGEPIDKYDNKLTSGCLVKYDYETNGGTAISGTVTGSEMYGSTDVTAFDKWKYKSGNAIDLTPEATKTGYEFIGWNTDKNATTGLTSLTAGTEDITLYAIYKTTKTVTYHTYDSSNNFTQTVDFYNNQTSVTKQLLDYTIAPNDLYSFVGYVFDENEADLENNILNVGDTFIVSDSSLDVYCVYDTNSILIYKNTDNSTYKTETVTLRYIALNIANRSFSFVLATKVPVFGYSFDGWIDSDGNLHEAGSRYIITDHEATVTASESEIYVDSILLTPKENIIYIGDTCELTATITPNNALDSSITWNSSNDSISDVDNGVCTGLTRGTVTITATNERSGKSDTATVIVKEAKSENPKIDISSDYKVTITAGSVQDDELDKIYYRINGGEWQEYKGEFPVYKKFVVEAYQVTKIRQVKSEIVKASGTEYATGITARYIGEDKLINTDVEKPEVKVTVHYPNSPDETTTSFNLIDYTIKVEGPNTVTVTYNEYPEDSNSPTLTSTIEVIGVDPKNRKVTIKGILRYSDGTPIANKIITLDYAGEVIASDDKAVAGANRVETTTDENGNYEFKDILVGKYDLSILDNNNTVIAKCNITVSAPKKDSVDVTDKKDNVDVSYEFAGNIIIIDATITNPDEKIVPPTKVETPKETPNETPITPSPKTGDNFNVFGIVALMITSLTSIIALFIKRKKVRK